MRNSDLLRAFLLGLVFTTALPGQVDAREIIRRAVAADELNWKAARKYTFLQRVELRWLDSQGKIKLSHVQTYDVTLQEGTPYRQLVQREDIALSPSEEKAEHERLAKSIAERRLETDVKRARRLSEYDRRPDWQTEAWHELPEAFEFRLAGEGEIDGHTVIIIEAVPREGYQPRSRTAKLFRSIKGKFWVDQQDHQIVKVEAEVIDTVAVGLFLVRVAKGSRAILQMTTVGDGVRLPEHLQVFASARFGIVKVVRFEQSTHFSRYCTVPTNARIGYSSDTKGISLRGDRRGD